MKHHTRRIAPRLTSGDCRDVFFLNLPPDIKEGVQAIAAYEHQSGSWVVEQVIYRWFRLTPPPFKRSKPTPKPKPRRKKKR